jgi:hypothetical protein
VLNQKENQKELNKTERGLAWDAPGITDSGPLLRLNQPDKRLTKAERYGRGC